ncbi:hypothetical protein NX059_005486 [Plenodomus lindquistii]|nr:hypothetical protein NX059_005486 [Plenodomus lindquistii]
MPKIDKASASHHRSSVSTASAAGGSGTRSSSWTTKDDEILTQARAQGLNWNQIGPKHFPSKTPNACRKRHERLMERQNAEQWDGVKLDVLAQAYMEVRREMWSILAARVGEKWQLVETKCMEKGMKNLTQAYRSAQKKQNDGTYHGHEDSGISISDLEEEHEDHHGDLPTVSEAHYSSYPVVYGSQSQQQRVPSIQSMLQPMQHQMQSMQPMQPHAMQPTMHQPIQHSVQQSLQQPMQQPVHYAHHSGHHIQHQQQQ